MDIFSSVNKNDIPVKMAGRAMILKGYASDMVQSFDNKLTNDVGWEIIGHIMNAQKYYDEKEGEELLININDDKAIESNLRELLTGDLSNMTDMIMSLRGVFKSVSEAYCERYGLDFSERVIFIDPILYTEPNTNPYVSSEDYYTFQESIIDMDISFPGGEISVINGGPNTQEEFLSIHEANKDLESVYEETKLDIGDVTLGLGLGHNQVIDNMDDWSSMTYVKHKSNIPKDAAIAFKLYLR